MKGPQALKVKIADFVALLQAGPTADRPFVDAFATAADTEDSDGTFFPEFLEDFRNETAGILAKVRSSIEQMAAQPDVEPTVLIEAYRLSHMLKGSAATMGFNRLSYLAHGLERIFEDLREKRLPISKDIVAILQEGIELVDEAIESMKGA
jgi:chemotaxis protein histidine kinase CheA